MKKLFFILLVAIGLCSCEKGTQTWVVEHREHISQTFHHDNFFVRYRNIETNEIRIYDDERDYLTYNVGDTVVWGCLKWKE